MELACKRNTGLDYLNSALYNLGPNQQIRASLRVGDFGPDSALFAIIGLCSQLDKKTGKSKFFFGPQSLHGQPGSTKTSINAEQFRLALDVSTTSGTTRVDTDIENALWHSEMLWPPCKNELRCTRYNEPGGRNGFGGALRT